MLNQKTIDELLEQACPSIQYRLRLEVLNQSRFTQPMLDLQGQILEDKAVKEVIGSQAADGWLAWDFHGYNSMESGIRLLCEKGVDRDNPILSGALNALREDTDRLDRGIGKVGTILDQSGLGGTRMIRAAVFAYAGIEDEPFIEEQIAQALAGFRAVLAIGSVDDLAEAYKGKLVYRQGILWPSLYHLRLLALTHSWRTPEAQREIASSVQRLVKLSPLPGLNLRYRSQLIAPASFCMDDFNPYLAGLDAAGWMMWFHRMELLARLGVVHRVPELEGQLIQLRLLLEAGDGRFTKHLAHNYFRRWGAYTGLMLEADWKNPQHRIYDLTFRSLLILHYYDVGLQGFLVEPDLQHSPRAITDGGP
jgi:hypothetical protein